jgi:hypothetical protein
MLTLGTNNSLAVFTMPIIAANSRAKFLPISGFEKFLMAI